MTRAWFEEAFRPGHSEIPEKARGMTDVGVGSGALLGHCTGAEARDAEGEASQERRRNVWSTLGKQGEKISKNRDRMLDARDTLNGRPRLLREPKPSRMASWPLQTFTGESPKIEGKLLGGIARVEKQPNLACGSRLVIIVCDTNGSNGLTSKMSHDHGWRAACIVTRSIPGLHFESGGEHAA
jgi:hypothetical protein